MNKYIKQIDKSIVKENVSLKKYNTMKLDSKARYLIKPRSYLELKSVIKIFKENNLSYNLIGNGSNILLTSKIKDYVIKLDFKENSSKCILMANELLPRLAIDFYNKGYSGLEAFTLIPASVGGAIYMNAGSYGISLSDIIEYVYYLDEDLKIKVLTKEECLFKYRDSVFKRKQGIILGCKVRLVKENKEVIKSRMDYIINKKKETQPLEYPSLGSIFKNPKDYKAYKLIDYVNLRGFKKNDALISDKHCNFIVNLNHAKDSDILYLIKLIQKKVKENFYLNLELEIVIID